MHRKRTAQPVRRSGRDQSRTTTESSAKNRSVAVLTTTTSQRRPSWLRRLLTLPAAEATPAPAQSFGTAPGTILALDLGTTAGFALRTDVGAIVSGTVSFRPDRWQSGGMQFLRFKRWLTEIKNQAGGVDLVVYEQVRRHAGVDAAHAFGGWLAILTAWCDHHEIAYQGVPVGTIKRFITGKGNADKDAVIAAIRARGFAPADDNEADALAILLWAIETQGGVR